MSLVIDNRQNALSIDECLVKILEKVVFECLKHEGYSTNYEVSLSFVDNDEISGLNYMYRNKQGTTDVLSFPMIDFEDFSSDDNQNFDGDIIKQDFKEKLLGDIVISTEKAMEQATQYGHSIQREIAFLTVHSMFHLMGCNHENETEQKEMRKKEENVLCLLGLKRDGAEYNNAN
ncbi:MAG: rRNA maturation RNase YbeY [Alkaliphilus sp.]